MQGREFKNALFEQFARIGNAFANPKRIEIIDILAQGERNVESVAQETGLSLANASQHLQVLKGANLVVRRKEGLQVFYRLSDPLVLKGYRLLRDLSKARLAEVELLINGFFSEADGLEPVEKGELLKRVRRKEVLVIDVRPQVEYAAGHIAGACSIPLPELERRLADLPKGKQIVAYCRGPYCVLAAEAVRLLRKRGIEAFRLEEGFPEWRDAGLQVDTGNRTSRSAKENTL